MDAREEEEEEEDDEEAWLQLRPVEPLPSQCCGSGCSPCVFDLYDRDLARWEAARASKDRSLLRGKELPVRDSSDKRGGRQHLSGLRSARIASPWGNWDRHLPVS